jgi:probable HAF family extracellular repeat protein
MKGHTIMPFARTIWIVFLVLLLGVPILAQQSYTIADLGTLGGSYTQPTSLNLFADVAGYSFLPGDAYYHAFLSHHGTMTELMTFGGDFSWTGAINNLDQVAGGAETTLQDAADYTFFCGPTQCHAALWVHGRLPRDLGTLPGGLNSAATGINNRGQVVGDSDITTTLNSVNQFLDLHAFVWQDGRMRDLGTLRTGHASTGNGINDLGHVTGASQINTFVPEAWKATGRLSPPFHAYVWTGCRMTDLHPASGNWGDETIGVAINNFDQIAGIGYLPDDRTMHAAIWNHGVIRDLGVLPGDTISEAWGINDLGAVVGFSYNPQTYTERPVLWVGGKIFDLSTMVPADSDLVPVEADAINLWGQIAGVAYSLSTGEAHAVILNPHFGGSMQSMQSNTSQARTLPKHVLHLDSERIVLGAARSR